MNIYIYIYINYKNNNFFKKKRRIKYLLIKIVLFLGRCNFLKISINFIDKKLYKHKILTKN